MINYFNSENFDNLCFKTVVLFLEAGTASNLEIRLFQGSSVIIVFSISINKRGKLTLKQLAVYTLGL
jgi:hypothetical protein